VAIALNSEISEKGMQAGLKLYSEIKHSEEYELNEGQMNSQGYDYLRNIKTEVAIGIFKLNVAAFLKSGNVYDSMGEAYLEHGDTELDLKH